MISVIILTMFKVDRLHKTLFELSQCDTVGEIILIDNSTNTTEITLPKLRHICEGKNTYINPAWNKGASLAKFDKMCFINDDVWFDWSCLSDISHHITPEIGMIGMSPHSYQKYNDSWYSLITSPTDVFNVVDIKPHPSDNLIHRPDAFGCCFFMHKDRYVPIPDELKLWCGDDWLFYQNRDSNKLVEGVKCDGFVSATLDSSDIKSGLDIISSNDIVVMKDLIKEGSIVNFFIGSWWE